MPKLAEPKAATVYSNAAPQEKEYSIADGRGLYLVVNPNGTKLWDFRYRFGDRRRKLAIKGGYPAINLKAAREIAERFRAMLAHGDDPAEIRKAGEEWMEVRLANRSPITRTGVQQRFERNLYRKLGDRPIVEITAAELLEEIRKVERLGKHEAAHRLLGASGQVFRYAIATSRAERDISADLRGALTTPKTEHRAALTDPKEFGRLSPDTSK
jgi:hypothetical protein